MQIEITLDQLKEFLKDIEDKWAIAACLKDCKPVLEESLIENVFRKPHSDTLEISTKEELQSLIKGGAEHKPKEGRPGAPYNREYLKRKEREGEPYPHKYAEYGFWHGTTVKPDGKDKLVMKAEEIMHRGTSYLALHETRRSVLKRAFLDAWQKLIDTIIKQLAERAKGQ